MSVFVFARRSLQGDSMRLRNIFSLNIFAVIAGGLLVIAAPALAGPPLICHAIDIGSEQSLPWTSTAWNLSGQEQYDVSRLVADTLALLTPGTSLLLPRAPLRRTTVYGH